LRNKSPERQLNTAPSLSHHTLDKKTLKNSDGNASGYIRCLPASPKKKKRSDFSLSLSQTPLFIVKFQSLLPVIQNRAAKAPYNPKSPKSPPKSERPLPGWAVSGVRSGLPLLSNKGDGVCIDEFQDMCGVCVTLDDCWIEEPGAVVDFPLGL
jgi:hypothetical protein